ncbi:hypothetical protein [Saccharothrix sp. HUAS TT1]|uniref:hypothetical protein n=1 Tax=unclassified Saccharothrix TaxID=2593673 RepID=UPI00345BDEBA
MTTLAEWPIVSRDKVVRAFQPGAAPTSEAPYRTLRRRHCATEGLAVRPRGSGRLQGQVRFFSRLNVRAAVCARLGYFEQAEQLACAARELEGGEVFRRLADHLAELPREAVSAAVAGDLPPGLNTRLVRAAAQATGHVQPAWADSGSPVERELALLLVHHGHVSELRGDVAWIKQLGRSPDVVLPRPLLDAAHRAFLGGPVVLRTVLTGDQAMVEVVPAVDLDLPEAAEPYSPFDRADPRTTTITEEDAERLSGTPAPLFAPVPVVIHE